MRDIGRTRACSQRAMRAILCNLRGEQTAQAQFRSGDPAVVGP
jgi:hypothetical protein